MDKLLGRRSEIGSSTKFRRETLDFNIAMKSILYKFEHFNGQNIWRMRYRINDKNVQTPKIYIFSSLFWTPSSPFDIIHSRKKYPCNMHELENWNKWLRYSTEDNDKLSKTCRQFKWLVIWLGHPVIIRNRVTYELPDRHRSEKRCNFRRPRSHWGN